MMGPPSRPAGPGSRSLSAAASVLERKTVSRFVAKLHPEAMTRAGTIALVLLTGEAGLACHSKNVLLAAKDGGPSVVSGAAGAGGIGGRGGQAGLGAGAAGT